MKNLAEKVFRFAPNRVWRVYRGGSGIDELRRAPSDGDGHFPEDWIASTSSANNPQYDAPDQGLSMVELPEGNRLFRDLLAESPDSMLGATHVSRFGTNSGLLMKILDSAERLPIQVHPSVAEAKRCFHSDFGKTEAWYVVAVRKVRGEEPYLLFGFNDRLDPDLFRQEALSGSIVRGREMLHRIAVRPGDRFIVPGGTPHAIGCGVTVIETMEPSDLVVQPELFCGEQRISEAERWSGAPPEEALKSFDFVSETEAELRRRCSPEPVKIDDSLSIVIPYALARYFEVQHLDVDGVYVFRNRECRHRAGVVISGDVVCRAPGGDTKLARGDAFFMPYELEECRFEGTGEIVFALPPPN